MVATKTELSNKKEFKGDILDRSFPVHHDPESGTYSYDYADVTPVIAAELEKIKYYRVSSASLSEIEKELKDYLKKMSPTNNGSTNNGSTNNGSTNNGSTKNGSTNNGSTKNGSTNNGSTKNGSTNNGSTNGTNNANRNTISEELSHLNENNSMGSVNSNINSNDDKSIGSYRNEPPNLPGPPRLATSKLGMTTSKPPTKGGKRKTKKSKKSKKQSRKSKH